MTVFSSETANPSVKLGSYYIFITLGQALGESRRMPPFLGVWIANFVFLAAGIHFLRKID
ncbi:MAG: LptF/LptG family permease [Elusimicrobia bacterium]|nr:LptF/LptG family permease [Elusimicrobiota bacterium]MBI3013439.1 LptF/LptG family permease [Elusimicrobiota bacterium]